MSLNNWFSSWWSNNFGSISFGSYHKDEVQNAVYIQNKQDPRHRIFLDIDGAREGRTTSEAPGGHYIKTGQDKEREDVTFQIQVENGKLCITCQNGDIELFGKNITLNATGDGNGDGIITLKSNSKIEGNSPRIKFIGTEQFDCNSEKSITIKSNGTMGMYGSQVSCQSASSRYGKRGTAQEGKITGD